MSENGDKKTSVYFTLEPDSVSNETVTSHQNVGCNQFQQEGPTSDVDTKATTVTGYGEPLPTEQNTEYDHLSRVGEVRQLEDVIGDEYS